LSEVERSGGEAEVLGTLAQRINEEHRAAFKAMVDTLNHAVVAGDLLLEAKKLVKYGEWGAWLEENFDGSERTARDYMRLARRRGEIEEAKRQSSAVLSISGALQYLGRKPGPLSWHNIPSRPEGVRIDPDVERDLEEEREMILAWERSNKEGLALMREGERIQRAGEALRPVANGLYRLAHPREGFRPEEAGEALALFGDARTIAALRDCVAWLGRVIEEAERAQGCDG
jgi:hypothetical protein